MKTAVRLLVLLALFSGAFSIHALVISSAGVADKTTSVPVTTLTAAELDRSPGSILDALRSLTTVMPPAADLAALKLHAPFSSMPNDQTVSDRFNAIPIAAISAVDLIRCDDETAGAALTYLLNNQRLNLSFGGLPGMDFEVRDDGSARYGSEMLNIHWVPQPLAGQTKINLYDVDGFNLYHGLAVAGSYMTLPGFEGKPPQISTEFINWALTNQNRSITAGSNALLRLNQAVDVFSGIATNLAVPTNITGAAQSIGRQLVNDTNLDSSAKQQKARDLLAYLQGDLLPKEQWGLDLRAHYKQTLSLTLSGKFSSANGYNEPFKKSGFFFDTVKKPGTTFPYTSYFGGYASVTNPTATAALVPDTRFWRISGKSDGTRETETFAMPELGGITVGGLSGMRLYIGGPSPDLTQFRMYGFFDTDNDGRFEPATKRQLFTSSSFINGGSLAWNPANGAGVILDRPTRNLYQFTGSGLDGFPTGVALKGALGNDRMDVWRLNLSYDGNWALGFPELGGNLSRFYQQAESYLDTGTGLYQAMRVGYAFEEKRLNAAAAGPIVTGGQPMRFTGTPDTEYRAYMDESGSWNEKSRAVTDPYGAGFFYIPGTDTALKIGAYIRFSQADGSEMSPRYTVTSDRPKPEFFPAKISSMDNLRLSYAFQPETSVALERSTALPGFSAIDTNLTSLFGGGYFSDCLPTPAASFYSWRLRAMVTPSLGMMDYYFVPPGVRRTLYPGWNDLLRPGSSFTLDNPVGLATSIMLLITMNAQTSAFLGTAATFSNNQMTYRLYQNAVFLAAYQTVVVPDTKRLLNPPVIYEPTGDISVPVRCLVIGGKNYPMMQFRLAYPDNCADAHWHGNSRVYHVANDNVGITDPNPTSCGYGSYEAIPQVEVKIPFLYWLAYRAYFFGQIAASQPIQLNEAVCSPTAVNK